LNSHIRSASTRLPNVTAPGRFPTVIMAVAVLSATLAVTGCGGDGDGGVDAGPGAGSQPTGTADGGGETEPGNACELFSEEEAEAVAGNPVEEGKLLGVLCIWEPEDLEDNTNLQLSVGYVPAPPGADVDAVCEAGLSGIPDSEPLLGTGLGNSAYWEFVAGGLSNTGSLHICFDGGMLDTAAIGMRPEAELQGAAISIAQAALGRL
jgi:hypothetical protein